MNENIKILCIDDEKLIRESLAGFLDDEGFKVFTAENGDEGLKIFREHLPDCILLDLRMPIADGFSVLNNLSAEIGEIPVIIISGIGEMNDVIEAFRYGAWDFITKPIINSEVIKLTVYRVLEKSRLIKENKKYRENLEKMVSLRTQELKESNIRLLNEISEKMKSESELELLNEKLELRVSERTNELETINLTLAKSYDDLKAAKDRLVQSEKMAALGGLIAGIAHEINTPLGICVTAATYLHEKTGTTFASLESASCSNYTLNEYFKNTLGLIESIVNNLDRASELINIFKQVAVDQTRENSRTLNVKNYIDEILTSLRPKIKKTMHEISIICDVNLVIEIYPGDFYQIISNLILNSITYGFREIIGGRIIIAISMEKSVLEIIYTDNGCGMETETLEKMFDPFFTTGRAQGAIGLGMHRVYNIVTQKLKGDIRFSSSPGNGVECCIHLPL